MLRLGVDVGGTFIKAGVVDESYTILHKVSVPTGGDGGFQTVVQNIARVAELAAQEAGLAVGDFESVGIGIPGLLNPKTGVVVSAPNLSGWQNVPFLDAIQKLLPVPVRVGNDANCAVVGETLAGAAKGCQNVVMLTLGTGVGGGIVADGKLFVGGQGLGAPDGRNHLRLRDERLHRGVLFRHRPCEADHSGHGGRSLLNHARVCQGNRFGGRAHGLRVLQEGG